MKTNSEKPNWTIWSAGAVVVLVVALGMGFGIRKIRIWRAEAEQREAAAIRAKEEAERVAQDEPVKKAVEIVEEVVEPLEPEQEVVVAASTEEAEEKDPEEDKPQVEPMRGPGMMGGAGERWRQMWANLNLTPEEQERLRAGFQLAMERFWSLSEEERQAEMARFQDMRIQWENMSDEEREATMGRMRDRFEDWRASGAVELPPMTLD